MTQPQWTVVAILVATLALFLWGRWRHDMVAFGALLAAVVLGVVPANQAFLGFGHPAVITVAAVLVLSRGLQTSGAIDAVARRLVPSKSGPTPTIGAFCGLAAALSAFMNNVGALALLMPLANQIADRLKMAPGRILMPLAYASILGGMTTLIGTPPNLIVSGFRAQSLGDGFDMFDFTPVGLAVALGGVVFVVFIGWRLVPERKRGVETFEISAYLTEARVPEKAKAVGMSLRQIEQALEEADAQVVGLVRNEVRITGPSWFRQVRAGDILVIEAEPDALVTALSSLGLRLEEERRQKPAKTREDETEAAPSVLALDVTRASGGNPGDGEKTAEAAGAARDAERGGQTGEIILMELVVLPNSPIAGRSATDVNLRTRFGINLLAISREGHRSMSRLRTMAIRAGDVLLMQGEATTLATFASDFGCVPVAERELRLPNRRNALIASLVMVLAIAVAALGLVPAAVSFTGGTLALMATRVVPPRSVYDAVDWPVIILLAALIPVAEAMGSTGAADTLARWILDSLAQGYAVVALAIILIITMTLSDFMNNAATAAVMCPIATGTAGQLGASADPFLMAVAVGASCAFLTPIGHQNNTLILGPGGFRFGDYWHLGLPLEIVVVAIAVPMLMIVWPL